MTLFQPCRLLSLPVLALACSLSMAQDTDSFSLFEDIERPESNTPEEQRVRRSEQQRLGGPNEPLFTLIGTTRIGSDQSALLLHQSGELVRVEIETESNTRIPGYNNFSVVHFEPRQVSIRYPDSELCQEFQDKGVTCSLSSNIAALRLVNREPLPPRRPTATPGGPATQNTPANGNTTTPAEAEESNPETPPANPFASLINARNGNNDANGATDGNAQGGGNAAPFQARRLDPNNVPDGMRIVSTPFGDRLVPQ